MDQTITRVAIYPPIGIARVGNSEDKDGFFFGPESPDQSPLPAGSYKDAQGAIKRQAARFRLYGYNAAGQVVREITAADQKTRIVWSAHLANKKSAWYQFSLAFDIPDINRLSRDQFTRRNAAETDRNSLINDPGERSIDGTPDAAPVAFDTGKVKDTPVYLGELRTDAGSRPATRRPPSTRCRRRASSRPSTPG